MGFNSQRRTASGRKSSSDAAQAVACGNGRRWALGAVVGEGPEAAEKGLRGTRVAFVQQRSC